MESTKNKNKKNNKLFPSWRDRSSTTMMEETSIWTIYDMQYDLSEYVSKHPGGKEAIMLGCGRDCTALFESYHAFTKQHRKVLHEYRVSKCPPGGEPEMKVRDPFYAILCKRADEALRAQGIDPKTDRCADRNRIVYYVVVIVCVLLSGYLHCAGSILGSFLFAVFGWLLGALGHDAGHFATSRKAWVNDVCVWGMSLLCNPIMWQHQHTYAHHSHTNEFDHDPDLHHFEAFLRVHRRIQPHSSYKHQTNRLYVAFAYAFVVFGTCLWIPWGMLKSGNLYGLVEWSDRNRTLRTFGFVVHLALYFFVVLIVPFLASSSWYFAVLASFVHVSTSGLLFAVFSQINHLNEGSLKGSIPSPTTKTKTTTIERRKGNPILNDSWAVEQIETSNNFAPGSTVWYFLSNGLNLQIEHHLFPGLNHCHLHRVSDVVKQTCEEFGVPYKCYETWSEIMNATMDWLRILAAESETALPDVQE